MEDSCFWLKAVYANERDIVTNGRGSPSLMTYTKGERSLKYLWSVIINIKINKVLPLEADYMVIQVMFAQ